MSSAEAELCAVTRALTEECFTPLGADFGENICIRAHVDAQANIRLGHRAGLGKARHIETSGLWVQDAFERREFEVVKVT